MLNCYYANVMFMFLLKEKWNMPSGAKKNKVREDTVNYIERAQGII